MLSANLIPARGLKQEEPMEINLKSLTFGELNPRKGTETLIRQGCQVWYQTSFGELNPRKGTETFRACAWSVTAALSLSANLIPARGLKQ